MPSDAEEHGQRERGRERGGEGCRAMPNGSGASLAAESIEMLKTSHKRSQNQSPLQIAHTHTHTQRRQLKMLAVRGRERGRTGGGRVAHKKLGSTMKC